MKKFSKNQFSESNCLSDVISNLHEHGQSLYELMLGLDEEFGCVPSTVHHLINALWELRKAELELRKADLELIERSKM